jgi:stage IV sporulation protein FB
MSTPEGRLFFRIHPLFAVVVLVYGCCGQLSLLVLYLAALITHELSHVFFADLFCFRLTGLEILPFGGVIHLQGSLEEEPGAEFVTALAGPVNNLCLAGVTVLCITAGVVPVALAGHFVQANLTVGLFNLLPALPLDGGRALRAFLTRRRGFQQATYFVSNLGRRLAVLLVPLGVVVFSQGAALVGGALCLAGGFLFSRNQPGPLAWRTWRQLVGKRRRWYKRGLWAGDIVMVTDDILLGEVARRLAPDRFHILYVLDRTGHIVGIVTEHELNAAILERGPDVPVAAICHVG